MPGGTAQWCKQGRQNQELAGNVPRTAGRRCFLTWTSTVTCPSYAIAAVPYMVSERVRAYRLFLRLFLALCLLRSSSTWLHHRYRSVAKSLSLLFAPRSLCLQLPSMLVGGSVVGAGWTITICDRGYCDHAVQRIRVFGTPVLCGDCLGHAHCRQGGNRHTVVREETGRVIIVMTRVASGASARRVHSFTVPTASLMWYRNV